MMVQERVAYSFNYPPSMLNNDVLISLNLRAFFFFFFYSSFIKKIHSDKKDYKA